MSALGLQGLGYYTQRMFCPGGFGTRAFRQDTALQTDLVAENVFIDNCRLYPNGWKIYARGVVEINGDFGSINASGNNGDDASNTVNAQGAGPTPSNELGGGFAGGAGRTDSSGMGGNGLPTSPGYQFSVGGNGGQGGPSSTGVIAGLGGICNLFGGFGDPSIHPEMALMGMLADYRTDPVAWHRVAGGAGGGAGGGLVLDPHQSTPGAGGGGGGGVIWIMAPKIIMNQNTTMVSTGGSGGSNIASGGLLGPGGGGGGGGIILICDELEMHGAIGLDVRGGSAGSSSSSRQGTNGTGGQIFVISERGSLVFNGFIFPNALTPPQPEYRLPGNFKDQLGNFTDNYQH